jgi:serine/threonine protein kinase/tetratricopeptide (TPR) repeat protein
MNVSRDAPGSELALESLDSLVREADDASDDDVAPSPSASLEIGQLLGERFEVAHLARRGGMGAIYRGLDRKTGNAVAIKIMGCLGRSVRARFLRETRILSGLSHPGIVRHLGHGTTPDGTLFLAMDWLDGEDLSERLARQPLSIDESLMLLRYVCQALELAHARGIVHRDIKPANLFLTSSDPRSVKLLDFGIARLVVGVPSLTANGSLLGTVGYMAPEQALRQHDVDARADLFALGCVLYECVTGKAPFASPDQVGVLAKVLREEPPRVSDLRADVDPRIDQLLSRLLAKKREDRPANVAVLLAELSRIDVEPSETLIAHGSQSLRGRSEQRIVSVILGKPEAAGADGQKPDQNGRSAPARSAHGQLLHGLSEKFGAEVARLKGGALLLLLSGRGEASDRAAQAALCALELQRRVPALLLGVATGLADTSGRVPVGAAIDRAAALLGESGIGSGVLLDDVTRGLIGLRFEVQRSGSNHLLLAARRDLDPPRLLMGRPTPHVGRERELRMLDSVLDECAEDRVARTVIVTGPPGMGKSRLAGEWLGRGGRDGSVRTLFARGDPGLAGSALSLVAELIRDAAGLREAEAQELSRAKLREHLESACGSDNVEQLADFVGEAIGVPNPGDPSPLLRAARGNPEVMREQTRRALHAWLDGETAQKTVVIVLEDLHWGDAPSVSFLTEALRVNPQRPLMLLALARPEAERQFPDLGERAALRIRLLGLSARAAEELVRSALPGEPEPSVLARVIRTAEGNPLYLEELIRRVAAGNTDWPDTVLAMAQSRIEQLTPEARVVLRLASVFGESCWDLGVREILDDGEVLSRLDALVDAELLVRAPVSRYAGAREYRFRHALLRDATYATLTDVDRASAHGLASLWLEQIGENDARLLADHCEAAGHAERARAWLVHAAKAAIDAGDLASTIQLGNRGVKLGASGAERGRFLLLQSYAEALRGEPDLEVTREALDLLPVGTALWWLGLGVLIFGSCMRGRPEEAGSYVKLAAEAPFARERDVPLGQGVLALVGGLVLLGKAEIAERILARARASADDDRDEDSDPVFRAFLAASRCALLTVAPVGGRWQLAEAYRGGRRAAEELASLGALHGQSIALYYYGIAAMHVGRYEEARDACLESAELTRRTSSEINQGWPRLVLAKAHLRLGAVDEALRAVQPLRSLPDWTVQQMLPVILAEARLREGNYRAAEEEAVPACSGVSPRLGRLAASVLARAQLADGRAAEALSTSERALALPGVSGLESEMELLTVRAEALFACGFRERAESAIQQARDAVLAVADGIDDLELRASFLANVEPCVRAVELAGRWSAA